MAKLKKADKDRKTSSRELEDHVVEKVGITKDDVEWEATEGEVHSDIHLEDDKSTGKAVVLKFFDFAANPEAFKRQLPTKEELFSQHKIQIERMLLSDDLKVFEEVAPKVLISKNKKFYRIIVAGLPWGMNRTDIPTLSQMMNGHS